MPQELLFDEMRAVIVADQRLLGGSLVENAEFVRFAHHWQFRHLCKGKGATYQKLAKTDFGTYVHEPGGDNEYGYVVVRQPTSGTGYHTTDADVRRLYEMVKEKLLVLR